MARNKYTPWKDLSRVVEEERDSVKRQAREMPTLYFAEVVSTDDPKKANRIKARIFGQDSNKPVENLPWCEPAMSSIFHIVPLVGELVILMPRNPWGLDTNGRLYIGPVFSKTIAESFDDAMRGFGYQSGKE